MKQDVSCFAAFTSLPCLCPWQHGKSSQIRCQGLFFSSHQVSPAAWWDSGGQVGLKPGQSCAAGMEYVFKDDPEKKGLSCMWFTNDTHIPSKPTLSPELRTFPKVDAWEEEQIARNPWMAPGSAPVFSPCGAAGKRYQKYKLISFMFCTKHFRRKSRRMPSGLSRGAWPGLWGV